ncbi:hypothetical protein N7447_001696 [Penicillium robsamsonii]|uniref:uncharacterized protein n=1 Tax=Penicillium robsamsonii TaxID=1792511 RepID=UPI002547744B|nr:uncharacterized protein N7447_001696 [Penicillium robsamsonii]KAJ5835670.1 hypothetical protein N7447_001696 [Penicillium robsamsonii]
MSYSKKTPYKKRKADYRRTPAKASYTKSNEDRGTPDKFIEEKVKKALSKANCGPLQSVFVRLLPCSVDRTVENPEFTVLQNNEWPASVCEKDRISRRRRAIVAICVPQWQSAGSPGHDCQPTVSGCEDGSEVARQVSYELLTKDKLTDVVDTSEKHGSARHIWYHDGPFAVHHNTQGEPVWKSVDGTAFTSRLSKEEGRPMGKVQVRMGNSGTKSLGSVCNMNLSSTSPIRTFTTPGQVSVGSSLVGMKFRYLDFFVTINRYERFPAASRSQSVSELPLELFLEFDGPAPIEIHCADKASSCGAITAMDMEFYYEWVNPSSPVAPVLGPTRGPA